MIKGAETVLKKITLLDSERILLRRFTQDDAQDVLEYGSDPETLKWLVWEGVKGIEGALESINGYYSENEGMFAIELKAEHKCIGGIDLRLDKTNEKASFGYASNRKYWGNGYMTEALHTLLKLAFNILNLNRVESTHFVGNEASGRVMQKCGMKKEGVFLQDVKVKGVFHDAVHYAIMREDFLYEEKATPASICMASLNDIDKLVQVRFDYFTAESWEVSSEQRKLIEANLRQYYSKYLNTDFYAVFVEVDNEIASVAFLAISVKPANLSFPTGRIGTVLNVLTYPEYRKKGYATKAMNALIDEAKKQDLSYIELSASESGKPLYKKLGFKEAKASARFTEMKLLLL